MLANRQVMLDYQIGELELSDNGGQLALKCVASSVVSVIKSCNKVTCNINHPIILSAQTRIFETPQHREFAQALALARRISDDLNALRSLVDKHRVTH
jgi:hypothetical protein